MGEWGESLANKTRKLLSELRDSVGCHDRSRLGDRLYSSEPDESTAQAGDDHSGWTDLGIIERARAADRDRLDFAGDVLHLRALHLLD